MPLSDEERLDRVYQRAASIKQSRRFRAVALAVPLLLVAAGVAVAANSSGRDKVELVQAGRGGDGSVDETTTTTAALIPLVTLPTTMAPTTGTRPPVPTTGTSLPTATTEPPSETDRNCGGHYPGDVQQPRAPSPMRVTAEASPKTIRRGQPVQLTLRARNTGSQPYTHRQQVGRNHGLFVHLNGDIYYTGSGTENQQNPVEREETFQPGEEKTYTVTWDTNDLCGPADGFQQATLRPGTYTVEGSWETSDQSWHAEPSTFQITT